MCSHDWSLNRRTARDIPAQPKGNFDIDLYTNRRLSVLANANLPIHAWLQLESDENCSTDWKGTMILQRIQFGIEKK